MQEKIITYSLPGTREKKAALGNLHNPKIHSLLVIYPLWSTALENIKYHGSMHDLSVKE